MTGGWEPDDATPRHYASVGIRDPYRQDLDTEAKRLATQCDIGLRAIQKLTVEPWHRDGSVLADNAARAFRLIYRALLDDSGEREMACSKCGEGVAVRVYHEHFAGCGR